MAERYLDRLQGAVIRAGQFAGSEIQYARDRFIVYGVGEPMPEVAAIIGDAPRGVEIVWRRAPYTQHELSREVVRIMDSFPTINTGSPRNDGKGILLTTTDPSLLGASDPQKRLRSRFPIELRWGRPPMPVSNP